VGLPLSDFSRTHDRRRSSQTPAKAAWHLDEVYLKIDGRMVYFWRAVDAEGEVLDVLIQARRNKRQSLGFEVSA
jgi:putative transposase